MFPSLVKHSHCSDGSLTHHVSRLTPPSHAPQSPTNRYAWSAPQASRKQAERSPLRPCQPCPVRWVRGRPAPPLKRSYHTQNNNQRKHGGKHHFISAKHLRHRSAS